MSNSRLGFHVQQTSNELEQAIDRCCPSDGTPFVILTLADDVTFWRRMKEKHPNIFLIARRWFDADWQQEQFKSNPTGAAIEAAQLVWELGIVNQNIADAVMGYNEFLGYNNVPYWNQGDIFQEQFYVSMKNTGFRGEPVCFGNGTGNMYGDDYVNNFPRTLSKYKLYTFHSYSWPTMQDDWAYQVGRFIEAMEKIRQVVPDAKAIITECGVTNAVVGGQDVGFKTKWTADEFWGNSLSFANNEFLKYHWLMGAAVFMVGISDYDRWWSFDCLGTSIIDEMAELSKQGLIVEPPKPTHNQNILIQLDTLWGLSNLVTDNQLGDRIKESVIAIKNELE